MRFMCIYILHLAHMGVSRLVTTEGPIEVPGTVVVTGDTQGTKQSPQSLGAHVGNKDVMSSGAV